MRVRRLRKEQAHLEITAFINLIVVLVPFLLSTAVFSRLAVIDLTLPAKTSGAEQTLPNDLKLEIIVRPDAIEVNDKIGGALAPKIPNTSTGPDVNALSALMYQLKAKFPDKREASILPEENIPYDTLVHVMDVVRSTHVAQGAKVVRTELFPNISIGKAPVPRK
jgi:biopolymer transport protein ExbD